MRRREAIGSTAAGMLAGLGGFIQHADAAVGAREVVGDWSPVYSWPDVAIHLNLHFSGRVASFSDDDHVDFLTKSTRLADFTKAFIVDVPVGGPPSPSPSYVPNTTTNLFCSGHTFLPDGRLIVFGGHEGRDGDGSTDINILQSNKKQFTWQLQGSDPMSAGRWYPSAIVLGTGEILVIGGQMFHDAGVNPLPEIWQPNARRGRHIRPLSTARLEMPLYSPIYQAPDGRVYMPGNSQETFFLETSGTGRWTGGPRRLHGFRDYGSSALYGDGKVLMVGGGDPPTNTAEVIDLTASSPVWQWTSPMRYARRQMNATLLADGKVLVTGGTSTAGFNDAASWVRAAEMWDPDTEQWTEMANMQVPRLYHSSALLLPDGRVLSAGGGRPAATNGGGNNKNAEIFSPPYLFTPSGALASRPVIASAPASVGYGQAFTVQLQTDPGSIGKVTWIGLSAVSHTFNTNQRISRLVFSPVLGGLNVVAPSSRNIAPPGHYMLFALDLSGVPSVAKIIRIG